jgi:hypothetical protein
METALPGGGKIINVNFQNKLGLLYNQPFTMNGFEIFHYILIPKLVKGVPGKKLSQ